MSTPEPRQITPGEVNQSLNRLANELDQLSRQLAELERMREPVANEYEAFINAFEVGLWEQHVNGAKLPPKDMRTRLAHEKIDPVLLGRFVALNNSRGRLVQRIADAKAEIGSWRSVLSAMKEGLI